MLASECLTFNGRLYVKNEVTQNAICQLEWAYSVLTKPAVIYQNGKDSHVVAGAIIDEFEDVLIDHRRFVAGEFLS